MKKRVFIVLLVALALTIGSVLVGWATVPPPVANQQLGIDDGVFNNLATADCKACHEDTTPPIDTSYIANRHHLLAGQTIPPGSVVPVPDVNKDGNPDITYGCGNCHPDDPATPYIDFKIILNCLECHVQDAGVGSVHHIAAGGPAQSGVCTECHGDVVDDMGDGHNMPLYGKSLVTPKASGGLGPPNPIFTAVTRGACDYCHATGQRFGTCSLSGDPCSLPLMGADCSPAGQSCNVNPVGAHDPGNPGTDGATLTKVY